ncbi:unnamed protein product [Cuscuta campestris]|uniref:Zinc finger PMZ-type domain-containing protein n=1 Tax=Cuscuta campestris TaxID=132261 RepID=A0A484NMW9_9ASTE|nr:unnamed protein product [Cuscuta campestris]
MNSLMLLVKIISIPSKTFGGKYPKYKDGVYAASRPFPISEERTWRCFVQKATKEYDELEVYLDAHQVEVLANEEEEMEEEEPINLRPDLSKEKDDKLITSKLISGIIFSKIVADADYKVRYIIKDIYDLFQVSVSYKKCWLAKSNAIQRLYGSWEDSYNKLLPLLAALIQSNPGSVAEIQMRPTTTPYTFQLMYVFWSFKASIDGFKYCFPVISVDGTHLYGKYKGVLLLAVIMTANHEIYPLAYSLVDKEDGDSWSWFMMHLMHYVVPYDMSVCIIFDRHGGIDVAFNTIPQLLEQRVTRRYCLRHLRSNFQKKFNSKKLKGLMYDAASTPDVSEFNRTMQQIKSQREEAYDWLLALPLEKWALCSDGGARYGILTTNLSESYNHVLKGCRSLPVYAIVKTTYERLVKLFAERRTNGFTWLQAGFKFPKYIWNEVRRMEDHRLHCHVIPHHPQQGIYRVVVEGNAGATGRLDEIVVHLGQKFCTCGKWATLHMPYVHVYAVCRYCNITVDDLIPRVFSLQNYLDAYSGNVMPLQNEIEWPTLGYELVHPFTGQKSQAGRPVSTRFTNNMDMRARRHRRGT